MTPDNGSAAVDLETALAGIPAGHKEDLRLWLRMLSCVNLIEAEIRRRLREQFSTTLPRFDLLAQLDREPEAPDPNTHDPDRHDPSTHDPDRFGRDGCGVGGYQPDGMTLGEISRRMMVSNGNVTALAAGLVADRLVERRAHATDRRAQLLCLTAHGRRVFRRQSAAHERWIAELFADVSPEDRAALHRLLGVVKNGVRQALNEDPG